VPVLPSDAVLALFGSGIGSLSSASAMEAELGAAYEPYHRRLALRLAALLPRPEPGQFRDYGEYLDASRAIRDVLVAEMWLRQCRAETLKLDRSLEVSATPLVDEEHRLISQETKAPEQGLPAREERGWRPTLAALDLAVAASKLS